MISAHLSPVCSLAARRALPPGRETSRRRVTVLPKNAAGDLMNHRNNLNSQIPDVSEDQHHGIRLVRSASAHAGLIFDSQSLSTVDIPQSVKDRLRKFRFARRNQGSAALVVKCNKQKLVLEVVEEFSEISLGELVEGAHLSILI